MKQRVSVQANVITTVFAEPSLNAVNQSSIRPIDDPDIKPVSDAELEDMAARLLATARASGKNITIENKGIPKLGMGGYYSIVNIRPDYPTVRLTMDELSRRNKGEKPQPVPGVEYEPRAPQLLKSGAAAWPEASDAFLASLKVDPAFLPHDRVVTLVRELDRRFMQLWDKVGFEREKGLLDYSLLHAAATPAEEPQEGLRALNDAIKDQREYFLSAFESRYGHGVIAMLSFDMQFPLIVQDYFQGGDDENGYIQKLLKFDWYPIAAGETAEEAINNLDAKMRRVTFSKTTPLLIRWLDYVAVVSERIRSGHVYEIVHAQYEDAVENAHASGN